jgi:hypothetical protein
MMLEEPMIALLAKTGMEPMLSQSKKIVRFPRLVTARRAILPQLKSLFSSSLSL